MAIDKLNPVSFKAQPEPQKLEKEHPEQVQPETEDKEKSTAAKLMLGATAVAASVLAGFALYRHFKPSGVTKAVEEAVTNAGTRVTEEATAAGAKVTEEAVAESAKVAEEAAAAGAKVTEEAAATGAKVAEEATAAGTKVTEEAASTGAKVTEEAAAAGAKVTEEATAAGTKATEEAVAEGAKVAEEATAAGAKVTEESDAIIAKTNEFIAAAPKLEAELEKVLQSGRKEVFELFNRVKSGENISEAEIKKFAEELCDRLEASGDDIWKSLKPENAEILRNKYGHLCVPEEFSRHDDDFIRAIGKLQTSIETSLPELIKARNRGVGKVPEAINKFESLLLKAEELHKAGNKQEAAEILKELQKHDIDTMAREYTRYSAAFNERNICTAHGMNDLTLYSQNHTLSHKAEELITKFKTLVKEDKSYVDAIKFEDKLPKTIISKSGISEKGAAASGSTPALKQEGKPIDTVSETVDTLKPINPDIADFQRICNEMNEVRGFNDAINIDNIIRFNDFKGM